MMRLFPAAARTPIAAGSVRFAGTPLLRAAAAALVLASAGCVSASREEDAARDHVRQTGARLHPDGGRPQLPALTPESPPGDYVRYAVFNHPAVEAAYDDWRASVAAIAPARALPDPQFTFQADVWDTLMSLMPGLMGDFMTPGKRAAMAREATASSRVAYRDFVTAVLSTAADARKAWIELVFVDESIRLRQDALAALEQSSALADATYATGAGMGTLEAQVRLASETARERAALASLGDQRAAARARFKSALGLLPTDPDPAWPRATLSATAIPGEDELWRRALAANPELGRMRAMVDMALAQVEVARKAGTPDFSIGAMVNLKSSMFNPIMARPTAAVTLPVWREKIAAGVAAAQARRDAAAARVTAAQVTLAAELARMIAMVRDSDRMIAYIDGTALPDYERVIATAAAGYASGMAGSAMIPETRLMAVNMRLERAAALRDREMAATDLLLMTAAVAPADSPLLAATDTSVPQPIDHEAR